MKINLGTSTIGRKSDAPTSSRYLLPFQGNTVMTIREITESKSAAGNDMLTFVLHGKEDDCRGKVVEYRIPVSGTNARGEENVLRLKELLVSVYSGLMETSAAYTQVNGMLGKDLEVDDLRSELVGKDVFVDVKAEFGNNGRLRSSIKKCIAASTFVKNTDAQVARRDLPSEQPSA